MAIPSIPSMLTCILSLGIPIYVVLFVLTMLAMWLAYIKVGRQRHWQKDIDTKGLNEEFGPDYLKNCPHQAGARFLHDLMERSAQKFPKTCAIRIAGSGAHPVPPAGGSLELVAVDGGASSHEADAKRVLGLDAAAPALLYQSSVTYRELSQLSSVVAAVLLQGGGADRPKPYVTAPDQIVAVLVPRVCVHPFVAQLGVLKAGAGVLMLDPNLPDSVLQYQIQDSKPVALLSLDCYMRARARQSSTDLEGYMRDLLPANVPFIDLDGIFVGRTKPRAENLSSGRNVLSKLLPSHLAMVIYTSGSTGKPKAVLVEHAGYVNYSIDYCDWMNFIPNYDVHGQMASLSFDASLEELHGAWCAGLTLVVLTDAQIRSGPDLAPLLCEEKVTAVSLVPSLLSTISRNPKKDFPSPLLRYITVGGEATTESLVEPWTQGRRELLNSYGPTEATIVVCRQSLRKGEPVTIGTPVANVSVFCIDHEPLESNPKARPLQVLPHGQPGELCCSGIQLARGYLNRRELTEEKFVEFSLTPYGRVYRTGDLCCVDPVTKRIAYHGRIDQQVKIRGNRIELGAVEHALASELKSLLDEADQPPAEDGAICSRADGLAEDVGSSAAEQRDDPVAAKQGEVLVAFLCVPRRFLGKPAAEGVEQLPAALTAQCRELLAKALPGPAIPGAYFFVPRLPRQVASGKIDRKALPKVTDLLASSAAGNSAAEGSDSAAAQQGTGSNAEQEAFLQNPAVLDCLQACQDVLPGLKWDDEFVAAGADSIKIAQLAGALRGNIKGVTVRDIIRHRTLKALVLTMLTEPAASTDNSALTAAAAAAATAGGQALNAVGAAEPGEEMYTKDRVLNPYVFSFMQLLVIVGAYVGFFFLAIVETVVLLDSWDWLLFAGMPEAVRDSELLCMVLLTFALPPALIVLQLLTGTLIAVPFYRFLICKFLFHCLLGIKLQPGVKYRKWSTSHFYVWVRMQCEIHVFGRFLRYATIAGADALKSFVLRRLGASVGCDVVWGKAVTFEHVIAEFLTVGDKCIFLNESKISTYKICQDHVLVAPLVIESKVKVGARAYIGAGARLKEGCSVDHLTCINEFYQSPAGYEMLSGVPGASTGIAVSPVAACSGAQASNRLLEMPLPRFVQAIIEVMIMLSILNILSLGAICVFWATWPFENWSDFQKFFNEYEDAPEVPNAGVAIHRFFLVFESTNSRGFADIFFVRMFPMAIYFAFVGTITFYAEILLLCYGILRNPLLRVDVGSYHQRSLISSLARSKVQLFDLLQDAMFGFNSKPFMMKAAGVTFDWSCSCSELASCHGLLPEATTVGANSFWANDCICTQLDFEGDYMKVQRSRFPQSFFMGNFAVIEPASHPTQYLVGVGTVAYGHDARRQMQTRLDRSVTIFGSPPMQISSDRQGRFDAQEPAAKAGPSPPEAKKALKSEVDGSDVHATVIGTSASAEMAVTAPDSVATSTYKSDKAKGMSEKYAGEMAFEPSFPLFLFRGWLFDGTFTCMKLFPAAIMTVLVIFWIINDFGPVYATMVVQKGTYHEAAGPRRAFSWRQAEVMGGMPRDREAYANWRANRAGESPGSASPPAGGRARGEGRGGQNNNSSSANAPPKPGPQTTWENNSAPPRLHFLATEELFLMDAPTEAMVMAHLRFVLYFGIFYAATPLLYVVLKWLVVRRVPSKAHSLFATIVQRHFFIWMLCQTWAIPFLSLFSGTLFVNTFYRLLGSKIGSRTLLLGLPGIYGDVDQWEVGSDSVVDGCVWQSHTFEDRIFWVMNTVIGDRCYVGPLALLMGGARVGSDASVLPLSVAWKMQELPPGTPGRPRDYHGSPPVEIQAAARHSEKGN